jgi:hypothetical protein
MMGGALPDPQAPLTPDDARQLLDEVLLGRPPRVVLAYERFEQRPIFLGSSHGNTVYCDRIPCRSALKRASS